jgi:hypothetical protein
MVTAGAVDLGATLLRLLGAVVPEVRVAQAYARTGSVLDAVQELFPTPAAFRAVRGELESVTVARLGGVGRLVLDLVDENVQLRAQLRSLESLVVHQRPLKRRSPAEWRFRVLRWEDVSMPVHLKEAGAPKEIPALRVWVPLEDKADGAPYWDLTGATLIAQVRPLLPKVAASGAYLHIRQVGEGRGSFHSITVEPA